MPYRSKPIFGGPGGPTLSPEDSARIAAFVVRVLLFAPILLLLFWASFSSFYTVQPEERGVIRRFGRFTGLADPGLHFKLPFGIDTVEMVATERVLKQEFGFRTLSADQPSRYSDANYASESLMLTGDLNVIEVTWVVQYQISDPKKYLFDIKDPVSALRDVSESVMRRIVGNRLGSGVLTTGRIEISGLAREEIQKILDDYDTGIHINTVQLQDVVPPKSVQGAFNEVNVARQERERMINEAEKRQNQLIPRTEGQALQVVAEAEGNAAERTNSAKGDVARFDAILEEYRNAPEVTRRRLYLEAIKEVLPAAGRVIVVQDNQQSPLPVLDLDSGVVAARRRTSEAKP